jgi:hypothetical protein
MNERRKARSRSMSGDASMEALAAHAARIAERLGPCWVQPQ